MGRPINRKCQQCALLPVEDAIAQHGPDGDNCWNPGDRNNLGYDCHRRRHHYRHREDHNRIRRRLRKAGTSSPAATSTPLELEPPLSRGAIAAVLVLYRQRRDTPVHAVAAEVWQGDTRIANVKPIHCAGMKGQEVTGYIQDVLSLLNQQFGVARFEDMIKEHPVEQCPIRPCPLRQSTAG